ncbi:MAG: ABC transporter substrate-binding protein [Candidatus Heimdallarchaeota archaeon]
MKSQTKFSLLILGLFILSSISLGQAAPQQTKISTTESPKEATALPAEIIMGGVFPWVVRPDAGRDRRDAFYMAVKEINDATGADRILPVGVNITAIAKDDLNTAEGGTAAANALVLEGADIVIGSSGSSVSAAMAAVLGAQKIVQISYASSSPSLSDRTLYPYFMRTAASDAWQGEALADLATSFGWSTGAVIHTSDSYGTGLIDVFTDAWGGTVATDQQFDPGTTDVGAQVQAIKDADPDFVVGNFIDEDAATVMQKAYDLDAVGMPWLMTDGWSTTATVGKATKVKNAMQRMIGSNPAPSTGAGYAAFNDSWFDAEWNYLEGPAHSQTSGTAFNSYAPLAYDAVYAAAHGLAAANTTDGDALLAALYDVTFEGASGSIAFDDIGEVIGRYDFVQFADETFTSFGEWQNGSTYDTGTMILQDGSQWTRTATTITKTADLASWEMYQEAIDEDEDSPGFTGLEVLLFLGLVGVGFVITRRKER